MIIQMANQFYGLNFKFCSVTAPIANAYSYAGYRPTLSNLGVNYGLGNWQPHPQEVFLIVFFFSFEFAF